MTVIRQLLLLAVLAIAAGAAWYALPALWTTADSPAGRGVRGGAETVRAVVTAQVRYESDAAVVEAVGTGQAVRAITLFPEAAGRVTELLFEAGQRVEPDQPLLRLDDDDDRLAVDLAKVRLQDARQRLARFERAAPSGAVSASEVDTARTALSAARIQLAQAELALRQRTLFAPFAGIVGIARIDVGDRVTEATEITSLDDRSTLLVDFDVPEAFAFGIAAGNPLTAITWALPGERFEGTVDSLATRIDPLTRTLRVRARLPNTGDRLRTGMSFVISLPLEGERFPSVPSVAVQWDRKGAFVWVVRGGKAERIAVTVMKRSEANVLVDAPLTVEDQVVVEGVQHVRPGLPVTVESATPLAAAEPAR